MAKPQATPFLLLPLLLLATIASALVPSPQQQPFIGAIGPLEIKASVVGLRDSNKQWPNQPISCTGQVGRISYKKSNGQIISTLLTFKFPTTQYKYCWLEFNAPAAATSNFRAGVFTTNPALTCPATGSISRENSLGFWRIPSGKPGKASWEEPSTEYLNRPMQSRCPTVQKGVVQLQGIEVVPPIGEDFDLVWTQTGAEGVRLLYSN